MNRCPACGQENRAERKFCASCGVPLAPVCASCGTANEPGERFCGECGRPLAEGADSPSPSPGIPTSLAGGRYQVRRFLGEGGKKRVYLAHDTKLDREVALALIKTDGLDLEGLTRVQREAQAMGRLGDHPHIVTVYDTGEEAAPAGAGQAQPYIVSQYMAGGSLEELLQRTEGHRLPLEQVARIAGQLCRALEHAHALGVIHRDLKPGNVWLSGEGAAAVGDFGLALALDRSRLTREGMMVGTASYMPPEQALGGQVTSRSDLYAFGCLLYELVTGRPPFVGDDAVAVISQHLNTAPVAPTWHNPACPPGLEALILRLLEKDANLRPAGATEVREALAAVDVAPAAPPAPLPPAEERSPVYRRTFVGREEELKQLESAFDRTLSGQGALVMVVGEPGIGKTTLTEQLTTYVAMRGGRTLVGHCYEEGSLALPYLPFVEAMRSYVLERDQEQLSQELGSGAADVARIVSEVRDALNVELPPPANPEEERFRLFQAVTAFLRNAAGVQPLCLVLEDLHDGDKGTMEMLVHLARNVTGARLLLVGTYRDVEVDRTHPLSAALGDLRRVDSFQRIPLRGLSPDEVQRMLSNLAGQDVPYVLAEGIFRQTEGNPLFIQEVMRFAAEEGLIRREGGQWVATVDSLITHIPEGLRDVIGKRLSRLSETCNRVLSVAAVIGRDFALDVLGAVAGVPEDELVAAIEEAVRASLLEERSEGREVRYRFSHAFFRQTLYEEMIAPRRLRMHNEVAKALERHYAGRLEQHATELAEHFSHSSSEEDLRKAVHYGELAAQRAIEVYAHGEAVRLLEQTLQVQEVLDPRDEAKRYELLMALGNSLLSAGEPRRVVEAVAPEAFTLAERLGGGVLVANVCTLATIALVYQGSVAVFATPEWQRWVERFDACAAPDSAERVMADGMKSWSHYSRREMEPCWRLRLGSLDLARRVNDADALAFASFNLMDPAGPLQMLDDRLRLARAFATMPGTMRPATHGQFLFACGQVLLEGQERALSDAAWKDLDAYAERVGDPYVRAWQMGAHLLRLRHRGELEEAVDVADRLAESASLMGIDAFGKDVSAWLSASSRMDLGRFEEVLALRERFESGIVAGDAFVAMALARAGRLDEARKELKRIIAERQIGPEEDWTDTPTLVSLLQAATLVEDEEAGTLLSGRLAPYAGWYAASASTTIARQLGRAALLFGDVPQARQFLETGLSVAERVEDRPETALVRFALARLLFEHAPDERGRAGEHLDFALNEFTAMKMQPALQEAMRLKLQFQGILSTDVNTSIDAVASAVASERPDLRHHAAPDGTVTLLFTDIVDSTPLNERLGDRRWLELLREHNALVRQQVETHGGFEVKSQGDGFMVAFQSARRALECAIAIQRAVSSHGAGAEEPLHVRIGLHTGEALREADDFYGKHVTLAARIGSEAREGEILVSSLLKELTDSAGDFSFDEGRKAALKGLSGTHRVFAVRW